MYELKKMERYSRVNLLWTGPSSYEKRIYLSAVSQRLRNSGRNVNINTLELHSTHLHDVTTVDNFYQIQKLYVHKVLICRGPCIVIYSYNETNEMH